MDPLDHGTLYETLNRTVSRWGNQIAYGVPPMARRSYHPQGKEFSWAETLALVEAYKAVYARAGYGYGHRIAFLFTQRPEFLFHYYALNALGCSVVLLNPDYKRDELQYVIEHSEACLAVVNESRLEDLHAVSRTLGRRLPVVTLEDFPDQRPEPPPAGEGTPNATTEAALR